jgi:hypothetical protein
MSAPLRRQNLLAGARTVNESTRAEGHSIRLFLRKDPMKARGDFRLSTRQCEGPGYACSHRKRNGENFEKSSIKSVMSDLPRK